jgi:competence protein ComEC
MQILAPPRDEAARIETRNNASVVLRVSYGEVDFLLPGDIEAGAEANLVQAYGEQLESEIVKVPHHGSSTSSTPGFVRAVSDSGKSSHAVISAGQGDQYGMPHEAVVSRWQNHGARVHSTATDGAVWIRSNGQEAWQVHWK